MQCAQCGYMLSPFDKVCPRCQHVPGMPVNAPTTPVQTPQTTPPPNPAVQVGTTPQTAAQAGFFGFLGAWAAALGLGCLVPLISCGVLVALAGIACLIALATSVHAR